MKGGYAVYIIAMYVESQSDADYYSEQLHRYGSSGFVMHVTDDPRMKLPAIRTKQHLYEGELNVGRVFAFLDTREIGQKLE